MKHLRKIFIFLLIGFLPFIISSCNEIIINPGPFDEYSASIFQKLVSDEMNSNYLFEDPTSFGLEAHYEPSLPTPSQSSALGSAMINLFFGQMPYYNYDELNFDEQMTYLVVEDLLDNINSITGDMEYLDNDYLGSYLGYQAQLPIILEEYNFRDVQDIDNYFTYFDLVPDTFKAYVDYEIEKADAGYGMPDYVIDKVVDQCDDFIASGDNNFLITTFEDRIIDLDFLTPDQIDSYIVTNEEKVTGPLYEGYQYVSDHLPEIKGKATNNLGLAYYDIGQEFYTIKFKEATGYDISMEDAIAYLDSKISERFDRYTDILTMAYLPGSDFFDRLDSTVLMNSDPLTQVLAFKEEINGIYPAITGDYDISVKYIDPSMEDHFSPAAYMTSPLDSHGEEFIYLNDKYTSDLNYLYPTLAHEGFPGHMYQNIFFKSQEANPVRYILKSDGYVEGWATYAEINTYKELDIDSDLIEYFILEDELDGALNARLDIGIHYQGWDVDDIIQFFASYGMNNYPRDKAEAILEQIVEVPTNPQEYYFTYFKLQDLYDEAKATMGDNFDPVTFHRLILECGPIPLRFVEDHVREYLNNL